MQHVSTGSPMTSQSRSLEVERRMTIGEMERLQFKEDQKEQAEQIEALRKKLALHEKAILGILGLLQIVFQDKYPAVAALLKSLTP